MKYIKLTQGKEAIVDDEDYPVLSRFTWTYSQEVTKMRETAITVIRDMTINMAEFLIKKTLIKTEFTHLNKDGLDFRKENLLVVSMAEARHGRYKKRKDNTSGFKGVYLHKVTGLAYAEIGKDGKRYRLGCFETPEQAALAYNKKAKEFYGDLSFQNKIE